MTEYDDDEPPRRRETIMDQRLRQARGEPQDDEPEPYVPRQRPAGSYRAPAYSAGGGGCAQAALYLVLGAIAILLILLFAGGRLLGGIGDAFNPAERVGELLATPTTVIVDRGATIKQIQGLSRLETARYSVETVVPVSKDTTVGGIPLPAILGGDELLLIAHGQVVAGVDLSKLRPEDVQLSADGKQISLTLPATEVFVATLDPQRTQVYSRDRGLFAPENKDLETEARQAAQARIVQSACEGGVMQNSSEEAQRSVERLLGVMGFTQVTVRSAPGTCADPSLAAPNPETPVP